MHFQYVEHYVASLIQELEFSEFLKEKLKITLHWKTEVYIALENKTLNVVKKYRVLDGEFKRQIESGNVFVCERHYESEDIEYTSKF